MNIERLEQSIKNRDFSVVLFWGKGCPACEQTKPVYSEYKELYKDLNLLDMQFDVDSYEFYSRFAEKVQDQTPILDAKGEPKLDKEGTPTFEPALTAEGKPVMVPKIIVPSFFVFSQEADGLGFIGSVDGHNPEKLKELLDVISFKQQGRNFR